MTTSTASSATPGSPRALPGFVKFGCCLQGKGSQQYTRRYTARSQQPTIRTHCLQLARSKTLDYTRRRFGCHTLQIIYNWVWGTRIFGDPDCTRRPTLRNGKPDFLVNFSSVQQQVCAVVYKDHRASRVSYIVPVIAQHNGMALYY